MSVERWVEPEIFLVQCRRKAEKNRPASMWWTMWPTNEHLTETEAKHLMNSHPNLFQKGLDAREYRVVAVEKSFRVVK